MGEISKITGDLGEAGCGDFFDLLGWTRKTDNTDYQCCLGAHKTASGKGEKKTHGIDFSYSYRCPYTGRDIVFIIDSKAIKWEVSGQDAKTKAKPSLAVELDGFVDSLHEKVTCAKFAADLKAQLPKSFIAHGLLFYFVHDGAYTHDVFQSAISEVSPPKDGNSSDIFVLSNHRINQIFSMIRHIQNQVAALGAGGNFKVCHFRRDREELKEPTTEHFTIENLLSSFVFVKITGADAKVQNHIYYFGEYDKASIQLFLSALFRYQLHLVDHLIFFPVSLDSPINNTHGINEYIKGKELEFGENTMRVTLGEIDSLQYKLKPKA